MTDERDFQPADIDQDTDDVDGAPIDVDEVPDVREDAVPEDDASASTEPTTEERP